MLKKQLGFVSSSLVGLLWSIIYSSCVYICLFVCFCLVSALSLDPVSCDRGCPFDRVAFAVVLPWVRFVYVLLYSPQPILRLSAAVLFKLPGLISFPVFSFVSWVSHWTVLPWCLYGPTVRQTRELAHWNYSSWPVYFILGLAPPCCDLVLSCTTARMREVSRSEWELPVNLLFEKLSKYLSLSWPFIPRRTEAAVCS